MLKNTLEKKTNDIQNVNDEIVKLMKEEEIEKEIVEHANLEEEIEEIICRIENMLKIRTEPSLQHDSHRNQPEGSQRTQVNFQSYN